MLKNYLKIALRNLLKHKGYSFINVAGLAIGMACCILILLWVRDELSYDMFHPAAGRIYRVVQEQRFSGSVQQVAVVAAPVAPALANDFPEVEIAVRVRPRTQLVSFGEKKFFGERIAYADSNVFKLFAFPLLFGDPETALATPRSVVLTASMAKKYFGGEDPMGKILKFDNRFEYAVTGVMKDIPFNSHLRAEAIATFSVFNDEPWIDNWGVNLLWTYVRLKSGAAPQALDQKLPEFTKKYRGEETLANISYYLQPLHDIHLRSRMVAEMGANGDAAYIYIFSAVGVFILLIAAINYMNLATARATQRMKEVGLRKVLGAYRLQLIRQFLGESLLLSFLALLCAVVVVEILLPAFNEFAEKNLALSYRTDALILTALLGVCVLVGVMAGSYPAFFLSAFQSVTVLKGVLKSGPRAALFRQVLVVSQFGIAIILLVGTMVVFQQLSFVKSQHLGFNKEHLVAINVRDRSLANKTEMVKSELLKIPQVVSATATSNFIGRFFGQTTFQPEGDDQNEWLMSELYVDADFIKTMEMQIVAGRDFSRAITSDSTEGFIVNEAAVKTMGLKTSEEALSTRLERGESRKGPILGVVKDFNFTSLHREIEPLVMIYDPKEILSITVGISPEEVAGTLASLEQTWNRLSPAWPFEYSFLDESLDALYRADVKVGQIFGSFAAIAVSIACLGLLGLAAFTAERRTKEIGIRKVLGASVSGVVALLSKEFLQLVLLANLIAWPVAYFAAKKWLEDFAYRVELGLTTFLLAAATALLIAFVTVSLQAIKAAMTNPIEALRYE
ncbi:ABC transporter permease [candidate division KSB1 bacterium]|nr:ABC transporter permease [candidate division KSB1 bacterium]